MLANVIFPAFTAPYVAMVFFPFLGAAVLASEVAIYRVHNRSVGYGRLLCICLIANCVSSLLGGFIAALLPSGLVRRHGGDGPGILTAGPYWGIFAIGGFFVGLLLSVGIEYATIRQWYPEALARQNLLRCVGLANTASYILLFVLTLILVKFAL